MAGVDVDNLGHDDTTARIDPSCATGVKVGFTAFLKKHDANIQGRDSHRGVEFFVAPGR